MKHIEEIQELPSRGGFMISVVAEFGTVHETWYYREVKSIKFLKLAQCLVIVDDTGKQHNFRVYGDLTRKAMNVIILRWAAQRLSFRPMDKNLDGYELCKRLASH